MVGALVSGVQMRLTPIQIERLWLVSKGPASRYDCRNPTMAALLSRQLIEADTRDWPKRIWVLTEAGRRELERHSQ